MLHYVFQSVILGALLFIPAIEKFRKHRLSTAQVAFILFSPAFVYYVMNLFFAESIAKMLSFMKPLGSFYWVSSGFLLEIEALVIVVTIALALYLLVSYLFTKVTRRKMRFSLQKLSPYLLSTYLFFSLLSYSSIAFFADSMTVIPTNTFIKTARTIEYSDISSIERVCAKRRGRYATGYSCSLYYSVGNQRNQLMHALDYSAPEQTNVYHIFKNLAVFECVSGDNSLSDFEREDQSGILCRQRKWSLETEIRFPTGKHLVVLYHLVNRRF